MNVGDITVKDVTDAIVWCADGNHSPVTDLRLCLSVQEDGTVLVYASDATDVSEVQPERRFLMTLTET